MLWQGRREPETFEGPSADPRGGRMLLGGGIGTVISSFFISRCLGGASQALFNSTASAITAIWAQFDNQSATRRGIEASHVVLADTEERRGMKSSSNGDVTRKRARALHGPDYSPAAARQRPNVRSIATSRRRLHSTSVFFRQSRNAWVQEAICRGLRFIAHEVEHTCRNLLGI